MACNLQQLQTQLRRLRIDPEGSNVVMQGDVTRIVSMSNRDRRGLIDELAGVALFDTRIEQTRRKLDDVQERQERCRLIEQELLSQPPEVGKGLREGPSVPGAYGNACSWGAARRWCWPSRQRNRHWRISAARRQVALEAQEQRDAAAISSSASSPVGQGGRLNYKPCRSR